MTRDLRQAFLTLSVASLASGSAQAAPSNENKSSSTGDSTKTPPSYWDAAKWDREGGSAFWRSFVERRKHPRPQASKSGSTGPRKENSTLSR